MDEILYDKECLMEGCTGRVYIYKVSAPSVQALRNRKKFCSTSCMMKRAHEVRSRNWKDPVHKAAMVAQLKKTLAKPEHRKRMSKQHLGSAAPWWKDNEATYNSKHRWVQKHFKRKNKCEYCGITPPPARNGRSGTEWSNISGLYDRNNRKDWQELCNRCHKFFDKAQRMARGGKPIDTTK